MTKEYLILFGAISDAIASLQTLQATLIAAQQAAEEAYISRDERG